jgi:hypothetical protein
MLPASYQLPAAIVLLIGGVISCFLGYRLFRIVLAISGFIIGAMLASSIFGASDTAPMIIAAIVGGLAGAAILFLAYFVGVALAGAAIGAVIANVAFAAGDRAPRVLVVILLAAIGAALAMYLQRYCIILFTAFGGAWTMIVAGMALAGDQAARKAAAANDVWVLYPLNPAPGQRWVPIAWIVLGLLGAGVQLGITGGEKGRVGRRKKKAS